MNLKKIGKSTITSKKQYKTNNQPAIEKEIISDRSRQWLKLTNKK